MQKASERRPSNIPHHLRPFHPRRPTPSALEHPKSQPINAPEYYYCVVPRRNWRELLTDLVLKDWQGSSRHAALRNPPCRRAFSQPLIMQRMKDSDDYLTARAANPRTGLISPSVSTATTPRATPSTPGEALELLLDPNSPTPDRGPRPPLQRANEGRKVSNETVLKWYPDRKGWLIDAGARAASPRVAHIKAKALDSDDVSTDDRFIVRMPSAQEPQPYKYPGCSARQINAHEQHRHRGRRVASSESYDPRRIPTTYRVTQRPEHPIFERRPLRSCDDYYNLHIPKRKDAADRVEDITQDGDLVNAVSFAPFSSPKTPTSARADDPRMAMKTLPRNPTQLFHRKPVGSGNGHTTSRGRTTANGKYPVHLAQLPQVKLVRPSAAAIPHAHPVSLKTDTTARRACSLGCHRDVEGSRCLERRVVSKSSALFGPHLTQRDNSDSNILRSTSDERRQKCRVDFTNALEPISTPGFGDILISLTLNMISACKHIHFPPFPRLGVVEVLTSEGATTYEKACALKAFLSSIGQVLAGLVLLAMLWQVGSVMAHLVEVVFWPLAVPVRILKWVAGVG